MDDDDGDDTSDVSDTSFKTHSGNSFAWADESDLSDAYVDVVEDLPLAAALPSNTQPPPADAAEPSVTATATPSAGPSTSVPSSAAETPVLFTPSESVPNAQPVHVQPANSSPDINPPSGQSQHVLDSQGLIKPDVIVIDAPSNPPPTNSSTSSARP